MKYSTGLAAKDYALPYKSVGRTVEVSYLGGTSLANCTNKSFIQKEWAANAVWPFELIAHLLCIDSANENLFSAIYVL